MARSITPKNGFQEAVEEFEKVVSLNPNGDKGPAALMKIGYANISINDYERGKLYLKEVVRGHRILNKPS